MRKFNVSVNGKSFEVEVEEVGANSAPVVTSVATAPAPVQTAPKMAAPSGGAVITSPMPGLILKLAVSSGSSVKKGDKILVLEAMKMENDITASADGVVTFLVKQGDSVNTGAELASIK